MNKNAVTFAQLTARLERAIHADVGLHGLNILIYGWITKYGKVTRTILNLRKSNKGKKGKDGKDGEKGKEGEYWLTLGEAIHFSRYVGYDLTHD